MQAVIIFVFSAFFTLLVFPGIRHMLAAGGLIRRNYFNKQIPSGMGLLFTLNLFVALGIGLVLEWYEFAHIFMALFGVAATGFLGFIDDTLGSKKARGIKGHLTSLFKGELTTGALKALIGLGVALMISYALDYPDFLRITVDTLIIAMSMNLFNLLDVRPGRAVKFFAFAGVPLVFYTNALGSYMISCILGGSIIYIIHELQAETMMGDTGSNLLGFCIGISMVFNPYIIFKIIVLVFLFSIHIFAEVSSISKMISGSRLLSLIDDFGKKY